MKKEKAVAVIESDLEEPQRRSHRKTPGAFIVSIICVAICTVALFVWVMVVEGSDYVAETHEKAKTVFEDETGFIPALSEEDLSIDKAIQRLN